VSAPVFLVGLAALHEGLVELDGAEGHHAADVRRLRPGEAVQLSDGSGRRGQGEVVSVHRGRLTVHVHRVDEEVAPQPRVVVVQALVKNDVDAVTTMTEVGVDALVPWAAQRSVVSWTGERAQRGVNRWRAAAHAAAKQSRRAWLPQVEPAASTAHVHERVASADLALVLDAAGDVALGQVEVPARGTVVLVVGPEGGLTEQEVESLCAVGAVRARLGPTVLRSTTAGTVGAGVLLSRTARWTRDAD
jgi:16S rRNA (uracil1498-N3)-methyltransferase